MNQKSRLFKVAHPQAPSSSTSLIAVLHADLCFKRWLYLLIDREVQ